MHDYLSILEFWFGAGDSNLEIIKDKFKLWWKKDRSLDVEIQQQFGYLLEVMKKGELDDWRESAKGRLAMIILADQFSRNIYRNTPASFVNDDLALSLAKSGIKAGMDKGLRLIERVFFYMPFMHAESLAEQEKAVKLFSELVSEGDKEEKNSLQTNLDFAVRHRNVIKQFGRFPHRNRILGRKSTNEEIEFLKTPGSTF